VLTIPLTVPNVIINDCGERFGFWREALVGSLFHLEQQSSAESNGGLLIGSLQRTPDVFA
jgi:hypothetical protein